MAPTSPHRMVRRRSPPSLGMWRPIRKISNWRAAGQAPSLGQLPLYLLWFLTTRSLAGAWAGFGGGLTASHYFSQVVEIPIAPHAGFGNTSDYIAYQANRNLSGPPAADADYFDLPHPPPPPPAPIAPPPAHPPPSGGHTDAPNAAISDIDTQDGASRRGGGNLKIASGADASARAQKKERVRRDTLAMRLLRGISGQKTARRPSVEIKRGRARLRPRRCRPN